MPIPVQKEQLQQGGRPKPMSGGAPQGKPGMESPNPGQALEQPPVDDGNNPVASKDNKGYIELKRVIADLIAIEKNPHGQGVKVKSESGNGVHTFTVTITEPDMITKAKQNGANVGGPPAPAPGAMASAKGLIRLANANAANKEALRKTYPESFLKLMGII